MEPYYLVTHGGDGFGSKVVSGLQDVYLEVLITMFGSVEDASADQALYWRGQLEDEDNWLNEYDAKFWNFRADFEDGYLDIQQIMDVTAVCQGHEHE